MTPGRCLRCFAPHRFGVARVVNFAHGEMMTIAMYAAVVLLAELKLDPFVTVLPIAAAFFVCGYLLQATVIQPFVTRPEHAQFLLLLAIAIILTNALLLIFGPDARSVQLDYLLESIEVGPLLVDRGKFYAALVACATEASSVTSTTAPVVVGRAWADRSRLARSRSHRTTVAPDCTIRSAVARPMPRLAPVTTATFFSTRTSMSMGNASGSARDGSVAAPFHSAVLHACV